LRPQSPDKAHDKEYGQDLFESLKRVAGLPANGSASPIAVGTHRGEELRKMKKFRFQLLHRWLVEHIEPTRVADIGGGKGLLAYLLQQSGWAATVIDPVQQGLPDKYKDITTGRRVRIAPTERVRHINRAFATEMGAYFDLLIGMHAHGCNAQIIDSATVFGCGFVLFPCCVIDEPFYPPLGVQWLESVADYATRQGHTVYPFRLNFKGQNIGLYALGRCTVKSIPSFL
jgi:hypothetical protein